MLRRVFQLLPAWLSLLALTGVVLAQASEPTDDDVNRVARQLYCPVCENVPLDVCPTQACADWRADIRQRLAQGWTDEQIIAYFAQQYGDRVLARPPARGLSVLVYLVPPLALALGAWFVVRFLRNNRRVALAHALAPQPDTPNTPDDYEARLEQELKERY
jgi:cytochrome c-type biogenesis protein CcmH